MDRFRVIDRMYQSMPDMPVKECWYDGIRPVCIAKNTPVSDEDFHSDFFAPASYQ